MPGATPGSESGLAFTIIMNLSGHVSLYFKAMKLLLSFMVISFTYTSNEERRNRQAQDPF
jgi:hypothetical protein